LNSPLRTPAKSPTMRIREQTPTVTVVICTRNRPVLLQKCLASVARLSPAPNQVMVIDNSEGNDDTRKVAHDYCAGYVIEPLRGLCRARNRALEECDTDVIAFLDDDVTPAPDWLALLLAPFRDEQIGASAGRVVTPDAPAGPMGQARTLSNQDAHWFEIATFGGLGLGANMALRKRACAPGKFFDERLGRGAPFEIGDESYAFASLLSRGHRVVYIPAAVVHHPPLTRTAIDREARNSFSYWLLLFSEFPAQRANLLRFLFQRLRGEKLDWPRNPQEPGEIVSSSWGVKLRAGWKGLVLFLRTPKSN